MARQIYLPRPDLFRPTLLSPQNAAVGKILLTRGLEAASDSDYQPNIAVLIRTKNDKLGLRRIFDHIDNERKHYRGRIDVIIVDTQSTDGTLQVAKRFKATVASISQAEFNYPKAINMGLKAVARDVVATFITIGHAQPAVSNCLQAGVRHFKNLKVAGVYGRVIPHENATIWEKTSFNRPAALKHPAHTVTQAGMGVMGATNCMVRMATWREHPFDEAYARGGEDGAWAVWALNNGLQIIFEPALTVHHTHGLGPLNLLRQYRHWQQISQPLPFDQADIKHRRPDLFK